MGTPLFDRLLKYKNRISFAMPGHKGRYKHTDLLKCDVTELSKTADLHNESESVKEANRLLARLYGADRSFILSSGSTTAIQAMITAAVKRGETLLTSADCHISVINICSLLGIKLRIINQSTDGDFLIPNPISSISEYLENYDDIKAVLITSPSYYGRCADVKNIAEECRLHNIPLLVDEAHGAHFAASDKFPESAVHYADMVCQSAHKTLNALTGAAYLHINGDIEIRNIINMYESSSPSYMIAASADIAREELENGCCWDECIGLCEEFKADIAKTGIIPLKNDDKTRLVLNLSAFSITGFEIEKILSDKYGIDIEMADLKNLVLIAAPSNTRGDFEKLGQALNEIVRGLKRSEKRFEYEFNIKRTGIINPNRAFYAEAETVSEANGRISKNTVCAYPPGIPIIITGETITKEAEEYINVIKAAGAEILGLDGDMFRVLKQ